MYHVVMLMSFLYFFFVYLFIFLLLFSSVLFTCSISSLNYTPTFESGNWKGIYVSHGRFGFWLFLMSTVQSLHYDLKGTLAFFLFLFLIIIYDGLNHKPYNYKLLFIAGNKIGYDKTIIYQS